VLVSALDSAKHSGYLRAMTRRSSQMLRPVWFLSGVLSVALGVIGIFLPVLPTTPLMILAAFCFSKSSPRFESMLLAHKTFGPVIAEWRENGAIAGHIKVVAVGTMVGVFLLSLFLGVKTYVLLIQFVCLGGAAIFVLTRPSA